jgi:hypothetical protein
MPSNQTVVATLILTADVVGAVGEWITAFNYMGDDNPDSAVLGPNWLAGPVIVRNLWQISQDVSAAAGQVQLDFEIGSPDASYFATYLILIYPQVQVIQLWAIPIPAIDPPVQFPISFPLPVSGVVGFYSASITEQGVQDFDLDWILLNQGGVGR